MSRSFNENDLIEDMDYLFGDSLSPEEVSNLHREGLSNINRLAEGEIIYFVIGSYSDPQKERVDLVRDILSKPPGDEAFILEELDPETDVWENFYVKFRLFLLRSDYVIGVFEDNDGGHELEIGDVNLPDIYVLKRDYTDTSINNDIEYKKFDAMLGTLFELLERREQIYHWESLDELKEGTRNLRSELGRNVE